MAVKLSPIGGAAAQFFDNSGNILTGGKLYTYASGTTTPEVTYTTSTGDTAQPNPIVLNAAGRVPDSGEIWLLDNTTYKFVLKDANDVQIAIWDNISGINVSIDASQVAYTSAGAGAVTTTVQVKLQMLVTPEDFGAVGNGITDDTAAWNNAISYLSTVGGGILYAANIYSLPLGITLACDNLLVDGGGSGVVKALGTQSYHGIQATGQTRITVQNLKTEIPTTNLRDQDSFSLFFHNCSFINILNCETLGGLSGCWMQQCQDSTIQNCSIKTCKADGVHFSHGSARCKAIGNIVDGAGDDSFSCSYYSNPGIRPTDILFANNTVLNSIWGFAFAAYSADRVTIVGNTAHNIAEGLVALYINEGGGACDSCYVANNNISLGNQAVVVPYSYWNDTPPADDPPTAGGNWNGVLCNANNTVIIGNRFDSLVGSDTSGGRTGVGLNGPCSNVIVQDNAFTNINGNGIDTGGDTVSKIILSSNTFENVYGLGINCGNPSYADNITITNNSFGTIALDPAAPYMIKLVNGGSTPILIKDNSSTTGKIVNATGSNIININNSNTVNFTAFTPVLNSTGGVITTYTATGGYYLVGNLVYFNVDIVVTDNGTGNGEIALYLPFPIGSTAQSAFSVYGRNVTARTSINGSCLSGGTYITLTKYDGSYPVATGQTLVLNGFYEKA